MCELESAVVFATKILMQSKILLKHQLGTRLNYSPIVILMELNNKCFTNLRIGNCN